MYYLTRTRVAIAELMKISDCSRICKCFPCISCISWYCKNIGWQANLRTLKLDKISKTKIIMIIYWKLLKISHARHTFLPRVAKSLRDIVQFMRASFKSFHARYRYLMLYIIARIFAVRHYHSTKFNVIIIAADTSIFGMYSEELVQNSRGTVKATNANVTLTSSVDPNAQNKK